MEIERRLVRLKEVYVDGDMERTEYHRWSLIHPQVDLIIVYQATYADNAFPAVEVWERPGKETGKTDPLHPFLQMLLMARDDERRQSAEDERELVERLLRHEAMQRQAQEPS